MESKLKKLKKGDKLKIIGPHLKNSRDGILIAKMGDYCYVEYKPNRYKVRRVFCNEYLSV